MSVPWTFDHTVRQKTLEGRELLFATGKMNRLWQGECGMVCSRKSVGFVARLSEDLTSSIDAETNSVHACYFHNAYIQLQRFPPEREPFRFRPNRDYKSSRSSSSHLVRVRSHLRSCSVRLPLLPRLLPSGYDGIHRVRYLERTSKRITQEIEENILRA